MSEDIIPPDPEQCQCEITSGHGPFVLGPKPKPVRCANKPQWLVTEIRPGTDGQYGSMCLCESCKDHMLKDRNLTARVLLTKLVEK